MSERERSTGVYHNLLDHFMFTPCYRNNNDIKCAKYPMHKKGCGRK